MQPLKVLQWHHGMLKISDIKIFKIKCYKNKKITNENSKRKMKTPYIKQYVKYIQYYKKEQK